MAVLHLNVLGGFEARLPSGESADIPIRKGQALLAYLALHPGTAISRSKLAGILWGDHGETQAQTSLRQTLTVLRKALAPIQDQVLQANRQSIGLKRDHLEVDAVAFQDLVAGGSSPDLETAISLYQGDLLDGFDVSEPGFETWLDDERRHLRELMGRTLNTLMEEKRKCGDREEAVALGQRLLALDPLQERVHRALMVLYGELGQREAALQQFQRCRELLEHELGVAPEAETEALYQALRNDRTRLIEGSDVPAAAAVGHLDSDNSDPSLIDDEPQLPSSAVTGVRKGQRQLVAAAALVFVVAGGAAFTWLKPWAPSVERASVERMAFPLPDRPSIAILPFDNLSTDPEQAFLAEGITDDLITELSKVSGLFVIARNSTSIYKGKAVTIKQVAEDLGVRYVLEGSVRRHGDQVRINAQLIDATTGGHVWAERYESPAPQIFDVQDKVLQKIVSTLSIHLTEYERTHLTRIPTKNLKAYDYFLRAEQQAYSADVVGLSEALRWYEKANKLDPNFAESHAGLARMAAEILRHDFGEVLPGPVARELAYNAAGRAIELQPSLPRPHAVLGQLQMIDGQHEQAVISSRRAVALGPNDAESHISLALVLGYAGAANEAVSEADIALRLNPRPPPGFLVTASEALFLDRQYDRAVELLERAYSIMPNSALVMEHLAMNYAQVGRIADARSLVDRILISAPGASLASARTVYAHHRRSADLERRVAALEKAGLPEWPLGFEGRAENRLTGAQITDLLGGAGWSGRFLAREPFFLSVSEKGAFALRGNSFQHTGRASVKGDRLCFRSRSHSLGREFCGPVFRKSTSSPDDSNEYVHVNGLWHFEFSVSN